MFLRYCLRVFFFRSFLQGFRILYLLIASFCRIQHRKKDEFALCLRDTFKNGRQSALNGNATSWAAAGKQFDFFLQKIKKAERNRSICFEPVSLRFYRIFIRRVRLKAPVHRLPPDSAAARPSSDAGNHTGLPLCSGRCSTSRASAAVRLRPHPCGRTDLPARP